MALRMAVEIAETVYSEETRAVIAELVAGTPGSADRVIARQFVNPEARCNIDSGRLELCPELDPGMAPRIARALVTDRRLFAVLQETLGPMTRRITTFNAPEVLYLPGGVGIVRCSAASTVRCGAGPRVSAATLELRDRARLLVSRATTPGAALARRAEFEALMRIWGRILVTERVVDAAQKPPHLDCLLRLPVAPARRPRTSPRA